MNQIKHDIDFDHLARCDHCGEQVHEDELRECPDCYLDLCAGCREDHACC